MKLIPLTQGKSAIVDDEDFGYLNQFKWCFNNGYAITMESRKFNNGKQRRIYMHRVILNTPSDLEGDHVNRNRLDNRKENLRICTHKQNTQNHSILKSNTSGYRGVHFLKSKNKWRVIIQNEFIGYFNNKKQAAKTYNIEALKRYGEFANLNLL
jgi:hypothetical protein